MAEGQRLPVKFILAQTFWLRYQSEIRCFGFMVMADFNRKKRLKYFPNKLAV
jgi:hypothetical protein